jgi:hypothetical protein
MMTDESAVTALNAKWQSIHCEPGWVSALFIQYLWCTIQYIKLYSEFPKVRDNETGCYLWHCTASKGLMSASGSELTIYMPKLA